MISNLDPVNDRKAFCAAASTARRVRDAEANLLVLNRITNQARETAIKATKRILTRTTR